jgi:hypothetical protein
MLEIEPGIIEHSMKSTIRLSINGSAREAAVLGEFLVHHTA